jgi:signal transduction histidine kinase
LKWFYTVALVIFVALAQLLCGAEITLSIFYMVPVAIATWVLNRRAGLAAAVIVTAVWLAVEVTQARTLSNAWVLAGNGMVRLVFLLWMVGFISRLNTAGRRLQRDFVRQAWTLRKEESRRAWIEREWVELYSKDQGQLAQQIHDELGQYLSALSYHSKFLAEDLHEMNSPLAQKADRTVALIRTTNEAIRRLGRSAQVPEESAGALAEALAQLTDDFERLTGVECRFAASAGPVVVDRFRSLMLFRIAQEACSNAVKHGKPTSIELRLTVQDSTLHVLIRDDGGGFNSAAPAPEGLGLRSMKRRATMMGGQLRIHSAREGCTLDCAIPLG